MVKKVILRLAAVSVVGFSSAPVFAQGPTLTKDAEFPEGFGLLSTVRELPDGRVMVADPLGLILAILDMDSGEMEMLGREGPGPDEYRQPDAVHALPGGATLLVDLGNARLTVIDSQGGFGETTPIVLSQAGGRGPGSFLMMLPRMVDEQGRIYFAIRGGFGGADSTSIGRYDRETETIDTLARVKPQEVERTGDSQNIRIRQLPMSAQDDWAVGPDGTIALVRSDGYYVQVIHPDGRVSTGPTVEHRLIRPRDQEKLAWLEAGQSSGIRMSVEAGPGGQRSISMSRGGGGTPDIGAFEWPSRMPAFRAGATIIDPQGTIWVGRTTRAGDDSRYDIFDGEGNKTGEVTFSPNSTVIGFGAGTAYVVRTDEFGLQWLERYRIA
ncbi:MAG: hypothetical protein IH968_17365 [Gemmatimonadetes bacterium]|nr:hypothetical protein [Gemmatimonadota bacterium]